MESRVGTENEGTVGRQRYSRIPLDLVRQYRTVLSRQKDVSGRASWTARVVGMPRFEANGSTRTEALRRVREMAASKGSPSLDA